MFERFKQRKSLVRWKANRGFCTVERDLPAEGLLGCASSLRDRRRKASGVQLGRQAKLSNPPCLMSGVRPTSTLDECKRQEKFLEKDAG
jgi:hypothetical protein